MIVALAGATTALAAAGLADLFDYTLRNVVIGSAILGVVGGALGTFALLRQQSLLGDALAHAALPGICIMFLLTGTKTPELILLGAAISGWIGILVLLTIVRSTRIKEDAALGTVLTVFFGFGILLLTRIQRSDNANQSGLDRYLFGQAATLLERDVLVMAVLAAAAFAVLALFYKEFKLLSFDRGYAASLGLPTGLLDVLLTSLIVLAVLIGLQTVGVVLMVAMLIAPAAAARQWTDRLGTMLMLSAGFGAASGAAGAILSSTGARVPTGPPIVLAATGILAVSLVIAPRHGILWAWLCQRRQRQRLAITHFLAEIHGVLTSRDGLASARSEHLVGVPFQVAEIASPRGHTVEEAQRGLGQLARRGLVSSLANGQYSLTETGAREAIQAARNQQLWQAYLANQFDLAVEAMHLDIGDLERVLPPEAIAQLEAAAGMGAER